MQVSLFRVAVYILLGILIFKSLQKVSCRNTVRQDVSNVTFVAFYIQLRFKKEEIKVVAN